MRHTQPGSPPGDERGQTERGLVELVAQGDEAAFMTIYDRYADALFGTAFRFLRDREAAAEVVQESFLALWRRARQFDAAAGSPAGGGGPSFARPGPRCSPTNERCWPWPTTTGSANRRSRSGWASQSG